ncbi:MAG: hypothetical protein GY898_13885 [Proteobacteria bacterium]|nr:hypothetical protein [Pseudomonadota bacterium]
MTNPHPVDRAMKHLADAERPTPPTPDEMDRVLATLAAQAGPVTTSRFPYPAVAALAAAAVFALFLLVPTETPTPTGAEPTTLAEITPTPEPRTLELRMATGRDDLEVVWVMTENLPF